MWAALSSRNILFMYIVLHLRNINFDSVIFQGRERQASLRPDYGLWMDAWMDGRTDGWMDGWVDGWDWSVCGTRGKRGLDYIYIYIYYFFAAEGRTNINLIEDLNKNRKFQDQLTPPSTPAGSSRKPFSSQRCGQLDNNCQG